MVSFWMTPASKKWEHQNSLAAPTSLPSPPILYYIINFTLSRFIGFTLFWNHNCYDCLVLILPANGSSAHQQFFCPGFSPIDFFILISFLIAWLWLSSSFSQVFKGILLLGSLTLQWHLGSSLLFSKRGRYCTTVMKSDASFIFYPVAGDFSFHLNVWSVFYLFGVRVFNLGNTFMLNILNKNFLGFSVVFSTYRFSSSLLEHFSPLLSLVNLFHFLGSRFRGTKCL